MYLCCYMYNICLITRNCNSLRDKISIYLFLKGLQVSSWYRYVFFYIEASVYRVDRQDGGTGWQTDERTLHNVSFFAIVSLHKPTMTLTPTTSLTIAVQSIKVTTLSILHNILTCLLLLLTLFQMYPSYIRHDHVCMHTGIHDSTVFLL